MFIFIHETSAIGLYASIVEIRGAGKAYISLQNTEIIEENDHHCIRSLTQTPTQFLDLFLNLEALSFTFQYPCDIMLTVVKY